MKQVFAFVLFAVFLTIGLTLKAQSLSEVFSNKDIPIFYYGIDFTKAKLINDPSANAKDIVERQFAGINALMINEPKKYDIAAAFRRKEMDADLAYTIKRNEKRDPDDILSSSSSDYNHLRESDVHALIKGFDGGKKSGVGLLFIVDAMSKTQKLVSVWVTLFDIKSRKVLLTDRVEGSVSAGFTFRNYWASGFKKIIDTIDKSKYNEWKSKYK